MAEGAYIFPKWFDRLQVRFMNPIIVQAAPYLPGFAQIVHKGRKSGTTFRTPVNPIQTKGRFVVTLGHGTYTDWVRNIIAAGGAEVRILGKTRRISNIKIVPPGDPGNGLPYAARQALKRIAVLTADID
ncbi:nitroreductase family deazaflavin-dependent oxidoreductase [Segniliparus rugosus]|uniref:Deazaflavin-dependent nitroreductase n=1 Tax=Segniliparus rugosus (strain ATCC BAA-974 / DSM 45345 / CCUG 50838 / CIP 108380 / JCM 13579 / CDC 945) TaxID=679197 RepID=E5XQ78_SEGRC|nr:nitroreductase family deazaflavin-dependent oxidoreductase [Segniliparus rugosus]EFV13511.1 deazaflavin-dependent nitroreductase [Segniliparus rugosus ATCC BAA-974]